MIAEFKQVKAMLTQMEHGMEEFVNKAQEVKDDNARLNEENIKLKKEIEELNKKVKG